MEPKYAKVYDALLERVAKMNPGERLDSEVKLASSFNVSPMTVRRALMLLNQDGLTVGIPGRGTFVTERKATLAKAPVTAENSWNATAALPTYPKLVSAALQKADESERKLLNTTEEPFIARIQRSHYLDENHTKLVGIEVGIIRGDVFPGILGFDLSQNLSDLLLSDHWEPQREITTSQTIRAALSNEAEAEQLHIYEPAPLLALETAFLDGAGATCAKITSKFLGEHVEINL
ncbi:GntR family transcriptional regulator [Actinomyces urinae]|uniref:GntR family transcriptional regulator n=1 Tax=Actinomyces urinae TaxID=1689268 RepID=UPI0009301418|nr:GntR family transcriptional regulator [Actinomyces urinae]